MFAKSVGRAAAIAQAAAIITPAGPMTAQAQTAARFNAINTFDAPGAVVRLEP